MGRLTNQDIEKIKELYAKIGTYAGVARETGFAPTTVKKYVEGVAVKKELKDPKKSNKTPLTLVPFDTSLLVPFDPKEFESKNWDKMLVLSKTEIENVKKLWEEIRA